MSGNELYEQLVVAIAGGVSARIPLEQMDYVWVARSAELVLQHMKARYPEAHEGVCEGADGVSAGDDAYVSYLRRRGL